MKTKVAILLGVVSPVFFVLGISMNEIWQKVFFVIFLVAIFGTFILGGAKGLRHFAKKSAGAAGKVWRWSTSFCFSIVYVPYAMFKICFGGIIAFLILCAPIFPILFCPWILLLLNKKL